jgi:tetratricopeptide (TPR) repeat protein
MKLIRWLLSNIILIAFILALTYAYVYWDNLTGPDTPAGKVIAVLTDEFESVREFVESYQPDTEIAEHSVTKTDTVVANQQTVAPTPVADQVAQPAPAQPVPPARQPAQPATQPAPVAPDRPVTRDTAGETERQLWIAARTAFQNGQYEKSIDLYRDIVAADTDSFDAWGEMGNVYLRIGDTGQAGAAYYEAAAIMVRLGQPARARGVLPLLYRLDQNKARQLSELIQKPARGSGV